MATITLYTTTSVISVQGSQHQAWVDSVLPEINARIDSESSLHHSTAINHESVPESVYIQMDSDDELVRPSPITSTPKPTKRSTAVSIGTQTPFLSVPTIYVQCHTECQTDVSCVSTCSIRGSTETEDNTPSAEHQNQISDKSPEDHVDNSCQESPAADNIFIATIPTDNLFSMLRVEETPDEQQASPAPSEQHASPAPKKVKVKPTPKPRTKIHAPIPKPRKNIPVSTTPASTKSSTSSPSKLPVSDSDLRRKTILIVGDSIPKHLDGRKMSKRCKVINRCIPGSNLELWTKLAPIFVKEEQPTCVIIHCATNNISSCYVNECVELQYVSVLFPGLISKAVKTYFDRKAVKTRLKPVKTGLNRSKP